MFRWLKENWDVVVFVGGLELIGGFILGMIMIWCFGW